MQDYIDNCERFVFFSRAVLEAIRLLDLQVDVLHANDWQTGLLPAYLKIEYRGVPRYENIASLFTIHNMAYQGQFWHWDMLLTGLDWKYFNWHQMEFYGNLNLLKTGLVFADRSTRSARATPRRSKPLRWAAGWKACCSIAATCCRASSTASTTANGTRPPIRTLPANYEPDDVAEGKAACKAALQNELGLPVRAENAAGGLRRPAGRAKGLRPDGRRHAATGCRRTTCNG